QGLESVDGRIKHYGRNWRRSSPRAARLNGDSNDVHLPTVAHVDSAENRYSLVGEAFLLELCDRFIDQPCKESLDRRRVRGMANGTRGQGFVQDVGGN